MTFLEAGEVEAGELEAGMSDPEELVARNVVPIRALQLLGFERDGVIDDSGFYVGAHPIDYRIASALTLALQHVPANLEIGSRLKSLPIASDEVMTRDAEIRVREALGDLIDAGQVSLLSVEASSPKDAPPGRVRLEVRCENLALRGEERVKAFVFDIGAT